MPTPEDLKCWMADVAQSGDREAFAALFRHFAPRIKGYLMRTGSPPELAEELAQEAMVTLWRRASTFDPQRAAVSTWLFTIARNLRIDHHRRMQTDGASHALSDDGFGEPQAALVPAPEEEAPEARAMAVQMQARIRFAVAALPEEQARVLRLSFFEDHAHAQIANELNLPLGTVKSRIRLAVAQLRRLLDGAAP